MPPSAAPPLAPEPDAIPAAVARLRVPAWAVSVVLHAALLVLLGWTVRYAPRGAADEPARTVGIVLRHATSAEPFYEHAPTAAAAPSVDAASDPAAAGGLAAGPPVDLSASLPSAAPPTVAAVPGPPGLSSGVAGMTAGPRGARDLAGGKGSTSVFGLQGQGYKFAYVFDRSGSMGGSGQRALNAAKAELLRSLESLEDTHQFQIIFYNEEPTIMPIAGLTGRLVFANAENKRTAEQFVRSITPDGGTQHASALMLGLRLQPDVLFFLTDADQPELSAAEQDRIRRLNGGRTTIHTIEFGLGPRVGGENFLARLARENGGSYVYIDVARAGR